MSEIFVADSEAGCWQPVPSDFVQAREAASGDTLLSVERE